MDQPTLSRRERLRAETAAEIKATALKQMATGGAAAVSLRAIARDMGMTAGAISDSGLTVYLHGELGAPLLRTGLTHKTRRP